MSKPEEEFSRHSRYCLNCYDPNKQRARYTRWKAKDPQRAAQIGRKAALKFKYAHLDQVRQTARIIDKNRRQENKAKRDAATHKARAKRRANKLYKLYETVLKQFRDAIKNPTYRGRGWPLLSYSPAELRSHIEAYFAPGMHWANYGHGDGNWEIDHIRPISSFDPEIMTPEQLIRDAFALLNLRPVWTKDNQEKSSHWNGQFWTLESHH